MWLVDRHTLMTLPEGTLYTNANGIGGLMVKGTTISHEGTNTDWAEMDLCGVNPSFGVDPPRELGDSCPLGDDGYGRNGCFDDQDRFLVYEKADLELLEKFIKAAKAIAS
jgi:hypothetical protein